MPFASFLLAQSFLDKGQQLVDDDLLLGGVLLFLLQFGKQLGRFFVPASVDAEQGQDQPMPELAGNCVDSRVKGKGLVVFAVPQAKLRIIFEGRNRLVVDQHQIQVFFFSLLDTVDRFILISQSSFSLQLCLSHAIECLFAGGAGVLMVEYQILVQDCRVIAEALIQCSF